VISTQKVDANNDARGAAPPKKAQLLFEGQETNKSCENEIGSCVDNRSLQSCFRIL